MSGGRGVLTPSGCICRSCAEYARLGAKPPYIEHGYGRTIYLALPDMPGVVLAVRADAWFQWVFSNVTIERRGGGEMRASYGEWSLDRADAVRMASRILAARKEQAARVLPAGLRIVGKMDPIRIVPLWRWERDQGLRKAVAA